jgi:hypothetical protein
MPMAGTVRNLQVNVSPSPGVAGKSYTFTILNNGSTVGAGVSCTVSGASTSCANTSGTVPFNVNEPLSLEALPSGNPNAVQVRWTALLDVAPAQ